MPDQPHPERFKAEMPQIPGVSASAHKRKSSATLPLALIGGLAAVVIVVFFVARWMLRPVPADTAVQ